MKGLIICANGMSSSLIAKKATDYFAANGKDISLEATNISEGRKKISDKEYDFYLVSPQAKGYSKDLVALGEEAGLPVLNIPPTAYVPIDSAISQLGNLIEEAVQ